MYGRKSSWSSTYIWHSYIPQGVVKKVFWDNVFAVHKPTRCEPHSGMVQWQSTVDLSLHSKEWKDAAATLDQYLHFDEWKKIDEDAFYDWKLVRKVKRSLRALREKKDARGCMGVLETCIRANFAGESRILIQRAFLNTINRRRVPEVSKTIHRFRPKFYQGFRSGCTVKWAVIAIGVLSSRAHLAFCKTYIGTKDLIESYYDEQEKALEFVRDSPDITLDEKKRCVGPIYVYYNLTLESRFFKGANTNYGISALCLSGGASFGYYHFGVVKAFLDAEKPLPRVITGTSAGGLIAALTCTRTDDELKILLVPDLANRLTACEDPFKIWVRRAWTTGARFDSISWVEPDLSDLQPGPNSDWYRTQLGTQMFVLHPRFDDVQGSLSSDRPRPKYLRYAHIMML